MKWKDITFIILIMVLVVCVTGSTIYTSSINNTTPNMTVNQTINNTTPTEPPIDITKVHERFNEIANTPFDVKTYNSVNKTCDFGDYLLSVGATNVNVVMIMDSHTKDMHCFIEWHGLYYDPSNRYAYFGVDKTKYLEALSNVGFDPDTMHTFSYDTNWRNMVN